MVHMVILYLTFEELPKNFPEQLYHFTFPLTMKKGFNVSISLTTLVIYLFIFDSHSVSCFSLKGSINLWSWRLALPVPGNTSTQLPP